MAVAGNDLKSSRDFPQNWTDFITKLYKFMYIDHSAVDTFFAGKVSAQIVWRCLEVLQATRAGQDGCVCKTGAAVCAVSAGT
jgi:hypothetical protein